MSPHDPSLGYRDLWIDGVRYRVPERVEAEVKRLTDLSERLGARLAIQRREEQRAEAGMAAPERWTTAAKLRVLTALDRGDYTRERAMEAFDLSEEELASWETAYAEGGQRALGCLARR